MLRAFRFLLRLAEHRGYERGLADGTREPKGDAGAFTTMGVRTAEIGRLPDGTIVTCTTPGVLAVRYPEIEIL